jgi:hypothetical protein
MMNVETYETISLDEQSGEIINEVVSEEALALIESLGLEGQRKLVETKEAGDEQVVTRIPYRLITKEELAIFGAIMPRRTSLARYSDGAIPLRVLQVAAHAQTIFNELEVWHPEPGRDDPLLIGIKTSDKWQRDTYILARWGEVLEPLDVLRAKARQTILANCRAKIEEAKGKIQMFESGMVNSVDAYLLGGDDRTQYLPNLSFARN